MTRKLFKNTMTALLALMVSGMLTCCINDEIVDTESLNSGEEYYMDFTFQSTSGSPLTRAGGTFVDGTHDEHDIGVKGNFALFFNYKKEFLLASDLRLKEHYEIDSDGKEGAGNTEEAIYRTRYFFRKEQEKNEDKMPKYVLVVLNGGNVEGVNSKYAEGTPMSQIFIDYLWKEEEDPSNRLGFYEENGAKFFTMSNSVYVGNDATEIKKENIQRFSEKYDPAKVTRVYVERMVSKFLYKEENKNTVDDEQHTYKFDPKTEEITLFCGYDVKGKDADDPNDPGQIIVKDLVESSRIVITGWGINALETRNYIFKNIDDTKSGWNIPDKYRYNWSVDPHYKYTHYPWQYRSAVENRKLRYYSDAENPSPLRNYSYTEFVNQTNQENGFDREVYAPENTYDPTNGLCNKESDYYLDNRTNLLAGTHLIVCAKFMTDFSKLENKEVYGVDISYDYGSHDLYRDNTNIYYATQKHCFAELVRRMNYNLKSNTSMRYRYYNWGDKIDGDDGKEFAAKTAGGYQLYYNGEPFTYTKAMTLNDVQLETANVLNGDGKLLPWLENDKGTWDIRNSKGESLKIYGSDYDYVQDEMWNKGIEEGKPEDERFGKYYEIKHEVTSDDVKSLMYEWMGAVDHFNNGKMYYAAPVLHIGADDPENAKESELGHYGVVRNTWYKFNLDNVTTVGAPIDNPDDPIVPNKVTTHDKLRFTINILPWHETETHVTLPK